MSDAPLPLSTLARRMVVAAAVVTVLLGLLLAASLRVQATARSRLIDTLDPGSVSVEQLRSSLVDQETGIRGYALGGTEDLLAPYRDGLARERRIERELAAAFGAAGDASLRARVAAVTRSADAWREQVATPLIDGRSPATIAAVVESSKPLFDEVRSELDAVDERIEQERRAARADLTTATRAVIGSVAATLVVLAVGLALATRVLRRRVIGPVAQLNERVRDVADGDFDADLDVAGPREIVELSQSASRMRDRIRAELHASETARAELHQQAEELNRSNRDLEQFAYVASHDLQEPLRKVSSFCQLLEDRYGDVLDERGTTYVHFAVDGAQRMQALIGDLLAFSRVGRSTDSFRSVDLDDLVQELVAGLGTTLDELGGSVQAGPLPVVDGDPSLLRALFTNLISNSIKYRSGEPPLIRITAEPGDGGWRLRLRDNGIGIEPQYREKVFVIFQRLHGRDEYEGTGIGLALCKKIVEFHGGSIALGEPPDGEGTQVDIWLPAGRAADPDGTGLDGTGLDGTTDVVDDDTPLDGTRPLDGPTALDEPLDEPDEPARSTP
ncbi:sensor histidine kinase [Dermatobacter hominis]|uniref:sensor histidine kinase n=1 Tax=Dermatobacter hominis TaxID=2884263 RepID=UPI001D109F67|nr:ATP-binding protein [Dermatobacter hominis]UDY37466.1 CHASE3 domain-containing protein [Dermatobacter hominis]